MGATVAALLLAAGFATGCGASGEASLLSALTTSVGDWSSEFASDRLVYYVAVGVTDSSVVVNATASDSGATIEIQGTETASGADSDPVELEAGSTAVVVRVTSADATETTSYYLLFSRSADTGAIVSVRAANRDAGDWFGSSVAASGNTLVVGAPYEASASNEIDGDEGDNSAPGAGAAYVFVEQEGSWVQQAYLKAPNAQAGDAFGNWLAIDGDTLVVTSHLESSAALGIDGDMDGDSAPESGAAFVFVRVDGTWSLQAYLKASNAGADDRFGSSVSISGDTVVIGAPGESSAAIGVDGDESDDSASGSGAAYVFVRNGTTWTQQAYLKASNTDAGDGFGSGIGISDDTTVVSATFERSAATGIDGDSSDNSTPLAGAGYVFVRNGTTWAQQAYLKPSNTPNNARYFGGNLISGDTIVMGSDTESSGSPGIDGDPYDSSAGWSGAGYVYVRSGSTWTQQAYVKASNPDPYDYLFPGALSGDVLVMGAGGEDSGASGIDGDQTDESLEGSGAAYLFVREGTTWSQVAYLKSLAPQESGGFGSAMAISGRTVFIAAPTESGSSGASPDDGLFESGVVYIFR